MRAQRCDHRENLGRGLDWLAMARLVESVDIAVELAS